STTENSEWTRKCTNGVGKFASVMLGLYPPWRPNVGLRAAISGGRLTALNGIGCGRRHHGPCFPVQHMPYERILPPIGHHAGLNRHLTSAARPTRPFAAA